MKELDEAIANEKAGARHNKYDSATLGQMLTALFGLGAVCPYCNNEGKTEHDEDDEKRANTSRGSSHAIIPSDYPIAVKLRGLDIDENDLHEFGIEDDPHVTVKYGFDDSDFEAVKAIVEKYPPFAITIGAAHLFERAEYDVLYLQAESETLRKIQAELTPIGDPPSFDTYNPHVTIAYLLVTRGKKYLPIDDFVGMTFEVNAINFSNVDDEETPIILRGTDMPFNGMSYNATHDLLYDKWSDHWRTNYETDDSLDTYSYVVASYPSHVIIRFESDYYEVAYAAFVDDEIVFTSRANWIEQERLELWIAKHAEFLEGLEDDDGATGKQKDGSIGGKIDDEQFKSFIDDESNFLKAVGETDDYWILGNHIVIYGDENTRDAEGQLSPRKNADGSIGEWFTSDTVFDSAYMKTGVLMMDIEHGHDIVGKDEVIGFVDAKSMVQTTKGLFAKRMLSKQSAYVQWLKEFYEKGIRFATSSEPVQDSVEKADNGFIKSWGLKRDTITFAPMEPRMYLDANMLAEIKATVGMEMPDSLYQKCVKSGILQLDDDGQDGGEAAGADRSGVARMKLKARAMMAQIDIATAM